MANHSSRESEVLPLLREDQDVRSVAERTGVPKRTIYDIRKRHFGPLKSQRSRRQRLDDKRKEDLEAFRADPELFLKKQANTYSFSLLLNLLLDCTELVFFRPTDSERYIFLVVDYLRTRLRRSSIAFEVRFRCLLVQAICINAARLRQHGDIGGAWEELKTAEITSGGCVNCQIEIERRRGYVAIGEGDLVKALAHVNWATERGGSTHDLHGQPLEKCLAAKSTVLFYMRRHDESYDLASRALSSTDPDQGSLVSQLLMLVALNIAARSRPELKRPRLLIHEMSAKYDLSEPSVVRGKLRWFLAVLDHLAGDSLSADRNFRKALNDFLYLEMPIEVTIVTIDRVRFDAKVATLAQTYSFREGVYVLPSWLEAMKTPILCLRKAVQLARSRSWFGHYCLELRDFLGGSRVLPVPSVTGRC